jgi:hypothetical protein
VHDRRVTEAPEVQLRRAGAASVRHLDGVLETRAPRFERCLRRLAVCEDRRRRVRLEERRQQIVGDALSVRVPIVTPPRLGEVLREVRDQVDREDVLPQKRRAALGRTEAARDHFGQRIEERRVVVAAHEGLSEVLGLRRECATPHRSPRT